MYGRPHLAAALSVAIEATAWRGAGTVSRLRDLHDKTLQDFLISSYVVYEHLRDACLEKKPYDLIAFLEGLIARTGKNIIAGEAFLLYNNVYSACTSPYVHDIDSNAIYATKYALERGLKQYLLFISSHRPSYFGRFSHSFFSDPRAPSSYVQAAALAKNIPFDPVIEEAANAYPVSRTMGRRLLASHKCIALTSQTLDELYRIACSRYIDYIAYRKRGLDAAIEAKRLCEMGEELPMSLGSIADVVGTSLYYYFNECFARGSFLL